ncbi:hypothetical protein OsJ_28700 [Oryza sativa Japonica Group]|uniref:Uncharacterized protein n=1 Tax=Oryza sativa subsp. japonica TaxID=39947 RepID=B9G2L7_ORYSJ|nr:hypothetical protein OsJ_28700 [Oryza sativa Japonica Group]
MGGEGEDEVLDPEKASALLPPLLPKEEKRMSQDHHELIAAAASLFLGEKIGGKFDSRVKKTPIASPSRAVPELDTEDEASVVYGEQPDHAGHLHGFEAPFFVVHL